MSKLILLSVFIVLLLVFSFIAYLLLRDKNWLLPWFKGSLGFASIAMVLLFALTLYELTKFQEISLSQQLVQLSIQQKQPQQFTLSFASTDASLGSYPVKGDLWRIEVSVLSWNPWLKSLKFPDMYKVNRVESRFVNIEQEAKEGATDVQIYRPLLNIWPVYEWISQLGIIDFRGYTLRHVPASDGSLFSIVWNKGALDLKAMNDPAKQALSNW